MGGALTTPGGKYLAQSTFSSLRSHRGLEEFAKGTYKPWVGLDVRREEMPFNLGTKDLLDRLERIATDALEIIKNVRRTRNFDKDDGLRGYLNCVMQETEDELRKYNKSVMKPQDHTSSVIDKGKDYCSGTLEVGMQIKKEKSKDSLNLKYILDSEIGLPYDLKHASGDMKSDPRQLQEENHPLSEENEIHKSKIEDLNSQVFGLQGKEQRLGNDKGQLNENGKQRSRASDLKEDNGSLQDEVKRLEDEVKTLQTRLSKLASDKLSENNPAIADLSDANRPTKLGEVYSELYDNEWTDAFEALEKHKKTGKVATEILRKTLLNVSEFCSKKAELFIKETDKTIKELFANEESAQRVRNTMFANGKPVARADISMSDMALYMEWEQQDGGRKVSPGQAASKLTATQNEKMGNIISSLRKDLGICLLPLVKKAYLSPGRWTSTCIPELEPFIQKCVQICWMMVVQRPPMCFVTEKSTSTTTLKGAWKPYTQSGQEIDYVVWPPLLLHDGGPLVANGVAQYK